jgi:hypothetical protein
VVITWNEIIIPLYGFIKGLGAPIIVEFAKISLVAIIATMFFCYFFERYD